jgi:deoxyribose-phosphate aldolase
MRLTEPRQLAALIDHSLLRATASSRDLERACAEAVAYRFGAVCVSPHHVRQATSLLSGTGVKICTVSGFPLGTHATRAKVFEAAAAVEDGADEIDMVANLGLIKDRRYAEMVSEVRQVVEAVNPTVVKVIIECSELSETEKGETVRALLDSGAHFVKTSTGFAAWGAKEHDVRLIREILQGRMKIKAAGCIRDVTLALALIEAGADRLGTSSGVIIVESFKKLLAQTAWQPTTVPLV